MISLIVHPQVYAVPTFTLKKHSYCADTDECNGD